MRTPANTMPPVNLDIPTKIIAVFVLLDSTVKTVKEVGAWGRSNYGYLFTVTVTPLSDCKQTIGKLHYLRAAEWKPVCSRCREKIDPPRACSRGTLREQSSSVCTNDFMGILHLREQNFHPAQSSTTFNRLNIWEQAPGANWANLKTLPRVYWRVQNEPGACSGSKTPRVYRP